MVSRRDVLAGVSLTAIGKQPTEETLDLHLEEEEADLERLYEERFHNGEYADFDVSGHPYGNIWRKDLVAELHIEEPSSVRVFDFWGKIGIQVKIEHEDDETVTKLMTGMSAEEAIQIRDAITIALAAQDVWGNEGRPGMDPVDWNE